MNRLNMILATSCLLAGCAGSNPNPGERSTDVAWNSGNFIDAFKIAKPAAERGEPWAQLRLGIFYSNGWGVESDITQAEYWYKKAAAQISEGGWANGRIVGAFGKSGYFNQNSDAQIAKYNLAELYFKKEKKLDIALELINKVLEESQGSDVFFCCEFSGGRLFSQKQFVALKNQIEEKISTIP